MNHLPEILAPAGNLACLKAAVAAGGHMNGCRIGFDAGGSDRKVSAVIDGDCPNEKEALLRYLKA